MEAEEAVWYYNSSLLSSDISEQRQPKKDYKEPVMVAIMKQLSKCALKTPGRNVNQNCVQWSVE